MSITLPRIAGWLFPVLALGCTSLFDESLVEGDPPPEGDGVCDGRRPADPPDAPDGPDGEELLFVLRTLTIDTARTWPMIGFNIDGLCTDDPDNPHVPCVAPTGSVEFDGEDGVDNSFGHHITPVALLLEPSFEASLLAAWGSGDSNVVVRVTGYNGQPNDPEIGVTFGHSVYGAPAEPDGTPPAIDWDGVTARRADDGANTRPEWEGDDWFWLRTLDFEDADPSRPRLRAERGWVTDHQLVAKLPDGIQFLVPLLVNDAGGDSFVTLNGGELEGTLSPDGRLFDLTLAGRWPEAELRAQARVAGFCEGSVEHGIAMDLFSGTLDVPDTPGAGSPQDTCTAMSFGIDAEALRGFLGGLVDVPPAASPCPIP